MHNAVTFVHGCKKEKNRGKITKLLPGHGKSWTPGEGGGALKKVDIMQLFSKLFNRVTLS